MLRPSVSCLYFAVNIRFRPSNYRVGAVCVRVHGGALAGASSVSRHQTSGLLRAGYFYRSIHHAAATPVSLRVGCAVGHVGHATLRLAGDSVFGAPGAPCRAGALTGGSGVSMVRALPSDF